MTTTSYKGRVYHRNFKVDYSSDTEDSLGNGRSYDCLICGDRATGKHYGAYSCDGCKGFFRRSIRKNHVYSCRYHRNCIVEKDNRNQCRYCRLMKCFHAGMKRETVQNERDRIGGQRSFGNEQYSTNGLSVRTLLRAEMTARNSAIAKGYYHCDQNTMQIATVNDICGSMKQQLLHMVQWAKFIPCFGELHQNDKIALLRAHAGEHLLLGLANRSLKLNDVLLLGNNRVIPRYCRGRSLAPELDFSRVGTRVFDELIEPLNEAHIDDTEFACLKAIIFFDPNARELTDRARIQCFRREIVTNLARYMASRFPHREGRIGELLLTMLSLQSIARQMIEQIQLLAEFCGDVVLDSLLQEMLLGAPVVENQNSQVNPIANTEPYIQEEPSLEIMTMPMQEERSSESTETDDFVKEEELPYSSE